MRSSQGEKEPPAAEVIAYGEQLRKIFSQLGRSQNDVASLLAVSPSRLSRFFSGKENTVAAREYVDALVDLVRESGQEVSDADLAETHRLRRQAQAVVTTQDKRIAVLQEQMQTLQALVGTFQGQIRDIESVNTGLIQQVDQLLARVQQEEARTEQERQRRLAERGRRKQAEARAASAEGTSEAALQRLHDALGQRDGQRARAARADDRARDLTRELQDAKKQLDSAAQYAHDSETTIDTQAQTIEDQAEKLRQLGQEVQVLRNQVQSLIEEGSRRSPESVAEPATQVREASDGDTRLREAIAAWVSTAETQTAALQGTGATGATKKEQSETSGTGPAAGRPSSRLSLPAGYQPGEAGPRLPSPGRATGPSSPPPSQGEQHSPGGSSARSAQKPASPSSPRPSNTPPTGDQGGGEHRRKPPQYTGGRAAARRAAADAAGQGRRRTAPPSGTASGGAGPGGQTAQPGGRAAARRAAQAGREASNRQYQGSGRAAGRQRMDAAIAARKEAGRKSRRKAIRYVCVFVMPFIGSQVAAFSGLLAHAAWGTEFLGNAVFIVVIAQCLLTTLFIISLAHRVAFKEFKSLTVVLLAACFIISAFGIKTSMIPQISEGVEHVVKVMLETDLKLNSR
ncbi:hypothetical protein [Streptomyces sp. NPDC101178]|uniref:hypothetical protein n=1 Tax=Streptomyces sp. NPDC101178 TaxID=3366124 RepID=UPI0037F73BC9